MRTWHQRHLVSILTRDQLRAAPRKKCKRIFDLMFQSSPAINCGRHRIGKKHSFPTSGFNPHPRSTAGVTQTVLSRVIPDVRFNPHPRSTAGVTSDNSIAIPCQFGFNPHPRSTAGVTSYTLKITVAGHRFNPHPRSTAGVTPDIPRRNSHGDVSILTRDQLRASRLSV